MGEYVQFLPFGTSVLSIKPLMLKMRENKQYTSINNVSEQKLKK